MSAGLHTQLAASGDSRESPLSPSPFSPSPGLGSFPGSRSSHRSTAANGISSTPSSPLQAISIRRHLSTPPPQTTSPKSSENKTLPNSTSQQVKSTQKETLEPLASSAPSMDAKNSNPRSPILRPTAPTPRAARRGVRPNITKLKLGNKPGNFFGAPLFASSSTSSGSSSSSSSSSASSSPAMDSKQLSNGLLTVPPATEHTDILLDNFADHSGDVGSVTPPSTKKAAVQSARKPHSVRRVSPSGPLIMTPGRKSLAKAFNQSGPSSNARYDRKQSLSFLSSPHHSATASSSSSSSSSASSSSSLSSTVPSGRSRASSVRKSGAGSGSDAKVGRVSGGRPRAMSDNRDSRKAGGSTRPSITRTPGVIRKSKGSSPSSNEPNGVSLNTMADADPSKSPTPTPSTGHTKRVSISRTPEANTLAQAVREEKDTWRQQQQLAQSVELERKRLMKMKIQEEEAKKKQVLNALIEERRHTAKQEREAKQAKLQKQKEEDENLKMQLKKRLHDVRDRLRAARDDRQKHRSLEIEKRKQAEKEKAEEKKKFEEDLKLKEQQRREEVAQARNLREKKKEELKRKEEDDRKKKMEARREMDKAVQADSEKLQFEKLIEEKKKREEQEKRWEEERALIEKQRKKEIEERQKGIEQIKFQKQVVLARVEEATIKEEQRREEARKRREEELKKREELKKQQGLKLIKKTPSPAPREIKKESKLSVEAKLRQSEDEDKGLQDTKALTDFKKAEAEIRKDRLALKHQQSATLPLRKEKSKALSPTTPPTAPISNTPAVAGTETSKRTSKIVKPPRQSTKQTANKASKS